MLHNILLTLEIYNGHQFWNLEIWDLAHVTLGAISNHVKCSLRWQLPACGVSHFGTPRSRELPRSQIHAHISSSSTVQVNMAKTSRVLHFVDCKWTISSKGKVIYMGSNGVAASIGRLADVLWNAVKAPNANLVDVIKFTVGGGSTDTPTVPLSATLVGHQFQSMARNFCFNCCAGMACRPDWQKNQAHGRFQGYVTCIPWFLKVSIFCIPI